MDNWIKKIITLQVKVLFFQKNIVLLKIDYKKQLTGSLIFIQILIFLKKTF